MVKLLVVDPHPVVSKGLELIFETTRDISFVGTLTDGEAIFDFIKHTNVDVILCEIDLPILNGVIMFSSQSEEIYALNAIKIGAAGYLSKTTDIITIKDAIMKAHNGGIYLSESITSNLAQNRIGKSSGTYYKKLSSREIEVLKLLSSAIVIERD